MADEAAETTEATETAPPAGTEGQEAPPTDAAATNGQANGSGADGAENGAVAGPEAALPSWRDGIPDDLKKSAEQFTSPTALLKSYSELRKQFNKSVQPLPDKPSEDQLAAFRKKQGIPDDAQGYGVEAPEWFDDRGKENLTDFLGRAHGLNLTPGQVQGVFEAYAGYMQTGAEADIAAVNANTEASVKVLKDEWGVDYDANLAVADRALSHFGGEEITETLKNMKLEGGGVAASHPAIVKLLAEVGRAASEPTGVHVPLVTSAEGREQLLEEADKLILEPDYYGDPRKQKRVQQIYEQVHGKQPHSGPGVTP